MPEPGQWLRAGLARQLTNLPSPFPGLRGRGAPGFGFGRGTEEFASELWSPAFLGILAHAELVVADAGSNLDVVPTVAQPAFINRPVIEQLFYDLSGNASHALNTMPVWQANSTAMRLKPAAFAGANPATGTIAGWFTRNSRRDRLKSGQPWGCDSPPRDHFQIFSC